jgi:transcriptional regulator with XRE-family HTH domain
MKKMKNEFVVAIGTAIKNLRMQKHISQYQLASKAGVSRSYLIRLEDGLGNPSMVQLHKLAKALDAKVTIIIA